MYHYNTTYLKDRIDFVQLAEHTGVALKKLSAEYRGHCPFHQDKTPSFSINPHKKLFYCFGCGAGGDLIKYVQLLYNYSFKEAVTYLTNYSGVSAMEMQRPAVRVKPKVLPRLEQDVDSNYSAKSKKLVQVAEHYHKTLLHDQTALHYLRQRGITDLEIVRQHKIGYCDSSLIKSLSETGDEYRFLTEIGILKNSKTTYEFFKGYLTFPFFDEKGNVGEIYGRTIDQNTKIKHKYLPGEHRGVFNLMGIKNTDKVFLCECVIDSLSLIQMGVTNTTCTFGKGNLTAELVDTLASNTKSVHICYDNDNVDFDWSLVKTIKLLKDKGLKVEVKILPSDIKDVNEYLTRYLTQIRERFLAFELGKDLYSAQKKTA